MTNLKILFVCSGTTKEGIGSVVQEQGKSLEAEGLTVEYFAIKEKGIYGYIRHIFKLKDHLKKNKYDIIHAHYGLSSLVTILAKKRINKLVISYMGNDLLGDHSRNGKSTFYGSFLVWLNKFYAKKADYIIVKSREMAGKVHHKNIIVIPNGLDVKQFYPIDKKSAQFKIGWDQNYIHLLFLADPERPEKNFKLLETSFNIIKDNQYRIHFLKNIPHSDTLSYYNAADVCILSSFHEGSPNVIKEAMACNSPVVSTEVGDVRYLFGSEDGYFVSSFDPFDLSNKIVQAINFRHQSGQTKGRDRIIKLGLDSVTVAKKIIEVYNKVLNLQA
jgi:teichuronic acid biosynthesis glycosyltransferase TuaC